ncbi:MAG: VCBS repeat-containing protein [Saprospiraceae bacterium]|nr:VCBS repeat-containing protein [Saprospiraceae bacterium]
MAQQVTFTDKTSLLTYITGTMGQAKCGVDMNGDGLDDITRVGADGLYIDYQKHNGTFQHVHFPLDVNVLPQWSICAGDLDRNGSVELLFGGGAAVSILSNTNGEVYVEKVLPNRIFSQRSTMIDINGDGHLDAFVCNDTGPSKAYRNNGSGDLLEDPTLIITSELSGNYSAIWSDFNNDGKADLYISKCKAEALPGNPIRTNLLYQNNGDGTFTEVGKLAGVDDNAQSWTSVVEDFDNDGDMDIFVVNHDQKNRLYRNNNDGTFTDVIDVSGIDALDLGAFEAVGGDFNNDGYMDILSELFYPLYLGNGDLSFTGQHLPFTPGAIGDFNEDGFLDVTYRSQLWLNNHNENHYIKMTLKGIESNPNGIGARIELYGNWGRQIRELRSGQGYSPMNTLAVHFGLGKEEKIDSLVVRWPSGIVTKLFDLLIDSSYTIVETNCALQSLSLGLDKEIDLCPGEIVDLVAPNDFDNYWWSNGSTLQNLQASRPGIYQVIYQDAAGCRGISDQIILSKADTEKPKLKILNDIYPTCEGQAIVLVSSVEQASIWSNGLLNVDTIAITASGIYYVSIDSVCGSGLLSSEPLMIEFFKVDPPILSSLEKLGNNTYEVKMTGENCLWYDSNDNLLFSDCEKTLTDLYRDTVFYVANQSVFEGLILSGGKQDTAGFKTNFPLPRKMYFTAWKDFVLETVDVYIKDEASAGERIISVSNNDDQVVATKNVNLVTGKNKVDLDFLIEMGKYSILCDRTDQLMNLGPLDYPFLIASYGQIDSSSVSLNFYPYFYNWQVRQADVSCISDKTVVPILATNTLDASKKQNLYIYPIPTTDKLFINGDDVLKNANYYIYTLDGQLIKQFDINDETNVIETSELKAGSYLIRIVTSENSVSKYFIVIR